MSTITYQCNVCRRIIQKLENQQGITIFGKCIITDQCHGKLYKIDRNIDNNRETFPFAVSNLSDYTPRKAFYNHNQTLSTPIWRITHNLSTSPAVVVYTKNTNGTLILLNQDAYTIEIIDKNVVNLKFNQSFNGVAQCMARSTSATTIQTIQSKNNVKITSNGIITLSIPEIIVFNIPTPDIIMDNLQFNIVISVEKPNTPKTLFTETILPERISGSSWSDWSKILLRKRKNYIVRTLNLTSLTAFAPLISGKSTLPNGTKIRFEQIQFPNGILSPIESRQLLALLSTSPYAPIDKLKNKLIDIGEMIDTQLNYFTYIDGELYVDSNVIESTYPDIIKVS